MADTQSLRFREDGKFTILVFTDIHETHRPFRDTITLIERSLDAVAPDLVVCLGDTVDGAFPGATPAHVRRALHAVLTPIAARGISFAPVFGNHDRESGVSNEEQLKIYQQYPGCLLLQGAPGVPGCGNYVVTVKGSADDTDRFALWMIDSGSRISKERLAQGIPDGYAAPEPEQIAWLERRARELGAVNGGRMPDGLLFQHIIVPEIYDALIPARKGEKGAVRGQEQNWRDRYYKLPEGACGKLGEGPCPPCYNTGEFAAIKRCNVLGAFFGHDHVNDFEVLHEGIRLTNCKSTGVRSYGDGTGRGVRVIELNENRPGTYQTRSIYFSDLVGKRLTNPLTGHLSYGHHLQILRDAGLTVLGAGAVGAAVFAAVQKLRKK